MTEQEHKHGMDEICRRLDGVEDRLNPLSENYVLKPILPYIQGAAGFGILWKALIAVGSLFVLYAQVKAWVINGGL